MERLLDAASALLRDKQFDDIHVAEIARRADVSVAAFYRRFKDKNALLHALHERLFEEALATADDALDPDRWQGAGIAEILFTTIPFLIESVRRNEALDRAVYRLALHDEAMRERSLRLSRRVVEGLSTLLMDRAEEIHHPRAQMAVSYGLTQAMSAVVQRYTVGNDETPPIHMSDSEFAGELTISMLAYLGVPEPYAPFAP